MGKREPILVAIPNTTELKMKAILAAAQAVENVSKALISVNTRVEVSNCDIRNSDIGINIATQESE